MEILAKAMRKSKVFVSQKQLVQNKTKQNPSIMVKGNSIVYVYVCFCIVSFPQNQFVGVFIAFYRDLQKLYNCILYYIKMAFGQRILSTALCAHIPLMLIFMQTYVIGYISKQLFIYASADMYFEKYSIFCI